MGLYNFRQRFRPHIVSGRKQHTIRENRSQPDRPGSWIHCYTGLRTRQAAIIGRYPCIEVAAIAVDRRLIEINGIRLDRQSRDSLAWSDGFENLADMLSFWASNLPFTGQIVKWERQPGRCRICGCTSYDCRQCVERTGEPCEWVEADLCSACVGPSR